MTKLEAWLNEARRAERVLARVRTEDPAGSDAQDSACRSELGFGLRAAQHRMAVARLLREPHAFTADELGDIDPSKLRSFAKKGLPKSRRLALAEIRRVADSTSSQLDDHGRAGARPPLRRSLAACLTKVGRQYRLTVAAQRRAGQLFLIEPAPFETVREAAAYLAGACWPVGVVVVSAEGLSARARTAVESALSTPNHVLHVLDARRDRLPLSPGQQNEAIGALRGGTRPKAERADSSRATLEVAACRAMGWELPTTASAAGRRAAVLLAVAQRASSVFQE